MEVLKMPRKKTSIPLKKTIGKYIPEKHDEYVKEFATASIAVIEEYIEVDPNYIRCISRPTKKMVDRVIYTAGKTLFGLVAKYADAGQQLDAVKANPANLVHIKNYSDKIVSAAFKHGAEWIKTAQPKIYPLEVQVAIVKADPQLVKWIIEPTNVALIFAAEADKSLNWLAKRRKL